MKPTEQPPVAPLTLPEALQMLEDALKEVNASRHIAARAEMRAQQAERHACYAVEERDRAERRMRQLEAELERLRAQRPPEG